MARKRRRKKIFGLFGAKRKRRSSSPMHCRKSLSGCMKGGGRARAGKCMREFQACRRSG